MATARRTISEVGYAPSGKLYDPNNPAYTGIYNPAALPVTPTGLQSNVKIEKTYTPPGEVTNPYTNQAPVIPSYTPASPPVTMQSIAPTTMKTGAGVLAAAGGTVGGGNTVAPVEAAPVPYEAGGTPEVDGIISQMKANSAMWGTADAAGKTKLHDDNNALAESLKEYDVQAIYNPKTGWEYLTQANIKSQDDFTTMSYEDFYAQVSGASENLTNIYEKIATLAEEIGKSGDVDYGAIMAKYLETMSGALDQAYAKNEEMIANGMNDPGLQAALQILREDTAEMRDNLLSSLNARGISRSGLMAQAEARMLKGQMSAESTLIGGYLSQLSQNYYTTYNNIINQRIAITGQAMELDVNSAFQNKENQITVLGASMNSLLEIANQMSNAESTAKGIAANMYVEGQKLGQQQEEFAVTSALTAEEIANRYNIDMLKIGVDVATLNETIANNAAIRANAAATLAELIRSNKAQETNYAQALSDENHWKQVAADQRDTELTQGSVNDEINKSQEATAHLALSRVTLDDVLAKIQDPDSGLDYTTVQQWIESGALKAQLGINPKVHNTLGEIALWSMFLTDFNAYASEQMSATAASDANAAGRKAWWGRVWTTVTDGLKTAWNTVSGNAVFELFGGTGVTGTPPVPGTPPSYTP